MNGAPLPIDKQPLDAHVAATACVAIDGTGATSGNRVGAAGVWYLRTSRFSQFACQFWIARRAAIADQPFPQGAFAFVAHG